MSWLSDLAGGLGIPGAAITIAIGLYTGCVAAEKAANRQALRQIGAALKTVGWKQSIRPKAIVGRVFQATFGPRHMSVKCLIRSTIGTALFTLLFSALFVTRYSENDGRLMVYIQNSYQDDVVVAYVYLVGAVLPDYIALAKTRLLIQSKWGWINRRGSISLLFIDLMLSVVISGFIFFWWNEMLGYVPTDFSRIDPDFADFQAIKITEIDFTQRLWLACCASTLFTSIWTALIMMSTAIIKVVSPIQGFTTWFFDIDKHPIRAIGIVASGLVVIGSAIWATVRSLI